MRRNFKPQPPTTPSPPPPSIAEQFVDLLNRLEQELSRPDITVEHRLKAVPFLTHELSILLAQINNIAQITELFASLDNNMQITKISDLANPHCDHGQVPVQSVKSKVNPRDQIRRLFEDFKEQIKHKQLLLSTSGLFFTPSRQTPLANPPSEELTPHTTHYRQPLI